MSVQMAENREPAAHDQRTMTCPKCRAVLPDFDGFGVLAHAECGYCTCPGMDGIGDSWFQCGICQKVERRFNYTGADFSGFHAAHRWLLQAGYSIGCMQGDSPIGILKGDVGIAKWRNMDDKQRDALDGTITWNGLSPRHGIAVVTLKVAPQ